MSRSLSLLLVLAACGGPASAPVQPETTPAPAPAVPPAAPVAEAPPQREAPDPERMASVLEVLVAGEYTIARMDSCGEEAWVAGPKTELTVGQVVKMPMGTVMTDFESKTLGRTFDAILFVNTITPADGPVNCPPPPSAKHTDPTPRQEPADTTIGVVKETMQAGGYTYARIDVCGAERWVAGPPIPLTVGDPVKVAGAMTMKDFNSPTLGRTFEQLDLVSKIVISGTPPSCP
ncbi:MAG: hypothetical protein KC621_06305 [Myxococcales bacterium]|nr:hypothetical protein [Myxococcales bacterium]